MNESDVPTATGFVRKMRGATQAHLLGADDGHDYVVKFSNNPQHRRVLVNELVATAILHHLHIATPESTVIRVTDDFLSENPEVHLQLPSRTSVTPGFHFGSRYPVDLEKSAVYDFLPDSLLNRTANAADSLGVYVVDTWLGNASAPQFIFFRTTRGDSANPAKFRMQSIGHGGTFDETDWQLPDVPSLKMDSRPTAYEKVMSIDSFQPWLDGVTQFPGRVLEQVREQIPNSWLEHEDASQHKAMLERLYTRRTRVPDLIRVSSKHPLNPFPNWKEFLVN